MVFPADVVSFTVFVRLGVCYITKRDCWCSLAPLAFSLNALRLLGRLLSTFAGPSWLGALNDKAYFPVVLILNLLLVVWFFQLAKSAASETYSFGRGNSST